VFIFIVVWMNKKIILINKFNKHNQVNFLSFKIKYINLYMSLDFFIFIFSYCLWLFFHLFTHNSWFIWLYVCIKIFIFTYNSFNYKNMLKKLVYTNCFVRKKIFNLQRSTSKVSSYYTLYDFFTMLAFFNKQWIFFNVIFFVFEVRNNLCIDEK